MEMGMVNVMGMGMGMEIEMVMEVAMGMGMGMEIGKEMGKEMVVMVMVIVHSSRAGMCQCIHEFIAKGLQCISASVGETQTPWERLPFRRIDVHLQGRQYRGGMSSITLWLLDHHRH